MSDGSDLPYFKFFASDWLSDLNVRAMDPATRGIYTDLLAFDWRENGIPKDHQFLAQALGVDDETMNQAWDSLSDRFIPHPEKDGYVTNKRLSKEREKVVGRKEKMSEAGRRGGKLSGKIRSAPEHLREAWSSMLREVDGTCPRCREDVGVERLTLDHIEPQYQGGEDTPDNIQPLCKSCNSAKGPESINWLERWRDGRPGRKGGGSNAQRVPPKGGSTHPSRGGQGSRSRERSESETEEEEEPPSVVNTTPSGAERVREVLWPVYLEELGGDGRQPSLTPKRKKKLRLLDEEHLPDDPEEAADEFRSILQAVQASDHHMSERDYQFPESLFKNAERRDKWAMKASEGSAPNGANGFNGGAFGGGMFAKPGEVA